MTDLYLIVHKVRGQPAFDIAEKIKCPVCEPIRQGLDQSSINCEACDHEGFWWIIPTSGHRAYPLLRWQIKNLCLADDEYDSVQFMRILEEIPYHESLKPKFEALPDHYSCNPSRSEPKSSTLDLKELGLL